TNQIATSLNVCYASCMDIGQENSAKEIPARIDTVKGIRQRINHLAGRASPVSFFTRGSDGLETKILVTNQNIRPRFSEGWKDHYRNQHRIGRAISIDIDERETKLNEFGWPDTYVTPRKFRLDTTAFNINAPKLFITKDQTPYFKDMSLIQEGRPL